MRWHVVGNKKRTTDVANALCELGDTVVSRWLRDTENTPDEEAMQDVEDVAKSDGLVIVLPKAEASAPNGSFELGMGIAFNKRVVLIGKPFLPAHNLHTIEHYENVKAFLETRGDEINA